MSLDGINSWSIHMLLGEENDLKQSDEILMIITHDLIMSNNIETERKI